MPTTGLDVSIFTRCLVISMAVHALLIILAVRTVHPSVGIDVQVKTLDIWLERGMSVASPQAEDLSLAVASEDRFRPPKQPAALAKVKPASEPRSAGKRADVPVSGGHAATLPPQLVDGDLTDGYFPRPTYPRIAREREYCGEVVTELRVRSDGSVGAVEIVKSSGQRILDRAVEEALGRWRFPRRFANGSYRYRVVFVLE